MGSDATRMAVGAEYHQDLEVAWSFVGFGVGEMETKGLKRRCSIG